MLIGAKILVPLPSKGKQKKISENMAAKRNYRANNTSLIEGGTGDNPKLMAQSLSDGRDSLYLEYYMGYRMVESINGKIYKKANRKSERLNLFVWQAPRTPEERKQNKETLALAKRIRFERGQELLEGAEGYRLRREKKVDILRWMWDYYEGYTKADKRVIRQAYNCFVDFLIDPKGEITPAPNCTRAERAAAAEEKAKRTRGLTLKPEQLTKQLVLSFVEYLRRRFRGEGAPTLYARYKKVIKSAVEDGVIAKNPCDGIKIKIDSNKLTKDVLSIEEVQKLIATHYTGENPDIRRAFIFCIYCGLRFCDVKDLTFANVDYSNRLLRYEQAKTKGHSSASGVVIPLNDGLLHLIGKGERGDLIFPLPSHNMCLKALRHWVARAGIDKHITWHCARHSFAVNILNNGANIKTVASLLGHSGLRHTEKYTRAVDSLKEAAINSLPELKL